MKKAIDHLCAARETNPLREENPGTTIKKRHREQTRHERQQNKDGRRTQRKTEKPVPAHSDSQEAPDLAGMVAAPQDHAVAFTG